MTEEQYREMLAAMAKRVEEHPDIAEAWRDLAQAKMMGGDFNGAIDDCIESLRLDPKNVNALIILGNIFTNYKKDDEAALRYYEKAVEVDPMSPDAQCNLGTLLAKRGDCLKAVGHLRRAVDIKADHASAYVMLAQCYAQMEDWHSAYITAKDAFEKCKVTVENEQIFERLSATLRRVMDMALAHGGDQPPQTGEKALEQALRQRTFDQAHEGQSDPGVTAMMTMYMLGAMERFDAMTAERVKQIAVEIAKLGTQGISPSKSSGYKIKSLPDEDFSGYRLLANYYVSWARAFPDKLGILGLPFDDAYKSALAMYAVQKSGNGDNSQKNTEGGVIHRIIYDLAA